MLERTKRHDIQAGDLMDMNSGDTNVEGSSALNADTTAAGDNMVMLTNPEEVCTLLMWHHSPRTMHRDSLRGVANSAF